MLDEALQTLEQAIAKYPRFDKLHLIRGQIFDGRGETVNARNAYAQGCKSCPKSIPLWILSARLEEKAGVTIKARSLLEKARLYNPKNEELWAESIKIEDRAGGSAQAKSLLARGRSSTSLPQASLMIAQQCRNVQHLRSCGLWQSSWRLRNNGKAGRSMRLRKRVNILRLSSQWLDYSGASARSRRLVNGCRTPSRRMPTGETLGAGG